MIRFCTHFAPLSYRYFYDPLIDIDISQRLPIDIDIDIFQNCPKQTMTMRFRECPKKEIMIDADWC